MRRQHTDDRKRGTKPETLVNTWAISSRVVLGLLLLGLIRIVIPYRLALGILYVVQFTLTVNASTEGPVRAPDPNGSFLLTPVIARPPLRYLDVAADISTPIQSPCSCRVGQELLETRPARISRRPSDPARAPSSGVGPGDHFGTATDHCQTVSALLRARSDDVEYDELPNGGQQLLLYWHLQSRLVAHTS